MRVTTVLLLCAALVMAASVWANTSKDLEYAAWNTADDISPYVGPVAPPNTGTDDMWDLLFSSEAGATVGDNQLLGGEFAGTHFYVTGGNSAGEPNQVYVLNADGTLDFQFDQWSSAGWGWRDLAYDGTYLYGSDDYTVDAFDLTGAAVPGMNINGPYSPCRALAYDPVTDHFWTASFSSPLYEFDRAGNVIWSGSSGLTAVYGAAWDDAAPDGPWLWLHDQTGGCVIHQFDPINHVLTGVSYTLPILPGSTSQMAGGLFFTNEWDPSLWTLGGVTQGTPEDQIFILEMYIAANPYAPAAPENFTVTPDPGGALSIDLTWDLPTTTVNGSPISSYPITSVEVLRDGAPLASLAATATSYTDAVPATGLYTYSVYCVNDSGDGVPADGEGWAGLDVPAAVENLVGEGVGTDLIAELTWDNPTTGAHGGYFPAGSIDGYHIVRNEPGGGTTTFEVTGIATSYTDNTVPAQGWYSYDVIPYNASGDGDVANTGTFYIGPPEFEEIPYDWVEINPSEPGALPGTNTGITSDDQNLGPFNLGFSFPFYDGNTFSSIRVCSNGFASFTSTAASFSNYPIPTTTEPNNLVAPFWDDMNPSQGGSIWYYADAANNRFIIEWYDVPHYSTGGNYRFEAILYADGTIDYMYADLTPGTANSATVGIENQDGTVGVQVTYNGSGPLEPTAGMGIRIYPVGGPPPVYDVTVTLTYVSGSPIPATGGPLNFDVGVNNNETQAVTFDAWLDLTLPNSSVVTVINRELTMPGGASILRNLTLQIPGTAPAGSYTATASVGDYPATVWDSDSFPFEKSAAVDGAFTEDMFVLSGWLDEADIVTANALPTKFAVTGAYPNPFNPTTTLTYALPEAAKVTLNVYDISGRLVSTLVNGMRDAGTHNVTFDGTGLASGVYIYTLKAGDYTATGKMVMMK